MITSSFMAVMNSLFQYFHPLKPGFTSKLAARIHEERTLEDKGPPDQAKDAYMLYRAISQLPPLTSTNLTKLHDDPLPHIIFTDK